MRWEATFKYEHGAWQTIQFYANDFKDASTKVFVAIALMHPPTATWMHPEIKSLTTI